MILGSSPRDFYCCGCRFEKSQKYYNLMDGQDAYYVALVLDPRFKTLLLHRDLGKLTAPQVVTHIKELLHDQYPLAIDSSAKPSEEQPTLKKSIEARLLQRLQHKKRHSSDIDRYFENDVVTINESVSQTRIGFYRGGEHRGTNTHG
jgi:hypothetical protein